jgi:hypothetical protein
MKDIEICSNGIVAGTRKAAFGFNNLRVRPYFMIPLCENLEL